MTISNGVSGQAPDERGLADQPAERADAPGEPTGWGGGLWAAADLITPMAIRVAATLRVADHIAAGRNTTAALAAATSTDSDALGRVLAHLVTAGVLAGDPGGYALTRLGEHLREDDPDGVRAWLDLDGAVGHADLSMVALLHTVRTGQPGFPHQFGRSFWEDLSAEPARAASFNALMSRQITMDAPAIATAYDWGALDHVVDVGGGDATLLIAILRAHPDLRGTVVDLPGPADSASTAIEAEGLARRAEAVVGSFFEPLPAGAGGYVLSSILHDWDDADARVILRHCATAAGADGTVLVVEHSGKDTRSTEMDLRMLTYFRGRERSLDQLADLAQTAGLHVTSVSPVLTRSIVELRSA